MANSRGYLTLSPAHILAASACLGVDGPAVGPAAATASCVDAHRTGLGTGHLAGRQDCVCLEIAADLLDTERREGKQTTECLSIVAAASPSSRTLPAAQQEDALKLIS